MRNRVAIGRAGEEAAARFLIARGYRIVEQNVRFRSGEIDIVARDGATLVFIEVKTRRSSQFGTPAEAVNRTKQQRLIRLAELYLASRGIARTHCRFDVVSVEPGIGGGWTCKLIPDAFGAG